MRLWIFIFVAGVMGWQDAIAMSSLFQWWCAWTCEIKQSPTRLRIKRALVFLSKFFWTSMAELQLSFFIRLKAIELNVLSCAWCHLSCSYKMLCGCVNCWRVTIMYRNCKQNCNLSNIKINRVFQIRKYLYITYSAALRA